MIKEKVFFPLLDRSSVHNDCDGDYAQVIQGSSSLPLPIAF